MSEQGCVNCHFCDKEIGYGWRLKRSRPIYLCDDCYDVISGVTLTSFPTHLRDMADFAAGSKKWDEEKLILRYFELGAEEEKKKGEMKHE